MFKACFTAIILLVSYSVRSQSLCEQSAHVMQLLRRHHTNPKTVDAKFIADLNREFFSALDPLRLYFSAEDFKSDSILISSRLLEGHSPCAWANSLTAVYFAKIRSAEKNIRSLLAKPLRFNEDDYIDPKSFQRDEFCQNQKELAARWHRWLTLEVLTLMHEKAQSAQNKNMEAKFLMSFAAAAQDEVNEKELKKITSELKDEAGKKQEIEELLIKSIARVFDPHSDFFSAREKKSFEEDLSATESSFGFDLRENNSTEPYISRVVPGSPAWKSNDVHIGDVLLQIRKPNGPFIDMDEFHGQSAQLLKSWADEDIELKLRRADGTIAMVKLAKEKIESVENRVQGFVLSGPGKIGYVALPSFYREWEDGGETGGCAEDLAKEIIKLKKEGIAGLILDLRYNGGGSVGEAIDLVGIFMDVGPVAIVKLQDRLITLKDTKHGSVYDGPLVVMVNGASASASEFVAAALQDYHRALIVGTPTYGKGTGQRIFASDSLKGEYLKITNEKLYRITGKSNQCKGVRPDVWITDLTEEFGAKEKRNRNVLPADSIVKKVYYTPSPQPDLSKIILASQARIQRSPQFNQLDSIKQFFRLPIPLKVEAFVQYSRQGERIQNLTGETSFNSKFKVTHNQFDKSLLTMDSFRKNLSEESLAKISKSIFIDEAHAILLDYISQIQKVK